MRVHRRSVLGIALMAIALHFTSPPLASSTPIDIDGCSLDVGGICTLSPVQFQIDNVDGDVTHELVGSDFAKIEVSVAWIDPDNPAPSGGVTQTTLAEFDYRYRIFDQQFTVTNFLLDLSLVDPNGIMVGPLPDSGKSNPGVIDLPGNTVSPLVLSYDRPDPVTNPTGTGFVSAVFFSPSITTDTEGSDIIFIRSTFTPDEVLGQIGGITQSFNALAGAVTLQGPGSDVVASAVTPVPEPSLVILLGMSFIGLAAAWRWKQHGTRSAHRSV